jgi:hypothetical protein
VDDIRGVGGVRPRASERWRMKATREIVPLHVTDVLFPPGHPREGDLGPVLAFAVMHEAGVLLFDTRVGSGEPEVD